MQHLALVMFATAALSGCGGNQRVKSPAVDPEAPAATTDDNNTPASETPPSTATERAAESAQSTPNKGNEFVLGNSDTARSAQGAKPSRIKATASEAAMKFIVVDKDKGPLKGIVISLTAPNGTKYYTEETDAQGYGEVLVPVGQVYELVYLSLGRQDIAAKVTVTDEPNQNIKLTLRYKGPPQTEPTPGAPSTPRFVLKGVNFDTAKANIRPESFPRLDGVVEYMRHKKSARIEISGHTDNMGNPKANKVLSDKRAKSCRDYLVSKGIEASRIEAVGYGDERPIASNDSEEGRQKNRRIEATEL